MCFVKWHCSVAVDQDCRRRLSGLRGRAGMSACPREAEEGCDPPERRGWDQRMVLSPEAAL